MIDKCKHNWTCPPECPQCCAEERDRLQDQNARLAAEKRNLLGPTIELLSVILTNPYSIHRTRIESEIHRLRAACGEEKP